MDASPWISNKLIVPEFEDYLRQWHHKLGDRDTAIYNYNGPELISLLLMTNAVEVHGFDKRPPEYSSFMAMLDNYDELETSFDGALRPFTYPHDLRRVMAVTQEGRCSRGYYDQGDMDLWGVERLLAIELRKMSIPRSLIKPEQDKDGLRITVSWDYLGRGERVLHFHPKMEESPGAEKILRIADCFYQKGFYDDIEETGRILSNANESLPKHAAIVLGTVINSHKREELSRVVQDNLPGYRQMASPGFGDIRQLALGDRMRIEELEYGMLLSGYMR